MDRCYVSLNGKRYILDIQEENIIFEMFQFINIKSIVISLRERSTPTQRWVVAIGVEMNNFFSKKFTPGVWHIFLQSWSPNPAFNLVCYTLGSFRALENRIPLIFMKISPNSSP